MFWCLDRPFGLLQKSKPPAFKSRIFESCLLQTLICLLAVTLKLTDSWRGAIINNHCLVTSQTARLLTLPAGIRWLSDSFTTGLRGCICVPVVIKKVVFV